MHPNLAARNRATAFVRPAAVHVRPFLPLIVSACDPVDGAAIFLAAAGGWARHPSGAAVACSPAEAAALLVAAEAQPDLARDPALVELASSAPCLAGAA